MKRHLYERLLYRTAGDAEFETVRDREDADCIAAMLRIAFRFVRNVRSSTLGGGALMQLHFAVAMLAAKLDVSIDESLGDGFISRR